MSWLLCCVVVVLGTDVCIVGVFDVLSIWKSNNGCDVCWGWTIGVGLLWAVGIGFDVEPNVKSHPVEDGLLTVCDDCWGIGLELIVGIGLEGEMKSKSSILGLFVFVVPTLLLVFVLVSSVNSKSIILGLFVFVVPTLLLVFVFSQLVQGSFSFRPGIFLSLTLLGFYSFPPNTNTAQNLLCNK